MLETYIRNKYCSWILSFWTLFSIAFLQAQDTKSIPDIEKVYLHTDRNLYFIGEDLWHKAYNVNAYTNLLYDNSTILYVELVAPDSKIVARNKTNLEIGIGNGDFQLKDSLGIKPGHYQLRAYTNWNRNFGDNFVFKKEIEIINVFEDHSKFNKTQNGTTIINPKTIEANKQNTFKVDFFPEGGSLLENVVGVVGFKAIDSNGKPIEIKGELFDPNNELVTAFESVHDGMGKFQLVPIEEKKYFAKIQNPAGEEIKVELPSVLKQGYSLHFRTIKGRNIVNITTNQATLSQNPNAQLTVVCKTKGIPYFETTKTLTETSLSFELPKDKTPDGISQITLFDNTNKPQSERLIYIEKNQDLEVQLTADKATYKPEEKATINLSSKSKEGIAKSASFSLSVTDMNGELEDKDLGSNICSHFLMESDIRGKVYNPAYYFDPTNSKRLEYLDNLLLTQGWRDFVWKTMPKVDENSSYIIEKGFIISGNVKQTFGSRPLVNNKLTLTLKNKKQMNFFSAMTDSVGRFKFENPMFFGKTTLFLNNRNEKGKFGGEIVLDPTEYSPFPVLFKNSAFDFSERTRSIAKNVLKKYVAYGVDPENMLNEVEIIGQKKNKVVTFYGSPDYSYTADENTKNLPGIYDILAEVPGLVVNDRTLSIPGAGKGTPLVLIDNYPAMDGELNLVYPHEVAKIDIIRSAEVAKYFIIDMDSDENIAGVISIITNGQRGNKPKKESVHAFSGEIEGFQIARIFYSPNPEKPNPDLDDKLDVRNTIYWNPYVHPDKTGNAMVSYNNSSVETKVKVDLEGITATGIPVVKKAYYTIKK